MLLTIAYYYLILGFIGTSVHLIRKRPNDSVLAYITKITIVSGIVLLPFGVLDQIFPASFWNYTYIPVAAYVLIRLGQRLVKELWRESKLEAQKGELA